MCAAIGQQHYCSDGIADLGNRADVIGAAGKVGLSSRIVTNPAARGHADGIARPRIEGGDIRSGAVKHVVAPQVLANLDHRLGDRGPAVRCEQWHAASAALAEHVDLVSQDVVDLDPLSQVCITSLVRCAVNGISRVDVGRRVAWIHVVQRHDGRDDHSSTGLTGAVTAAEALQVSLVFVARVIRQVAGLIE